MSPGAFTGGLGVEPGVWSRKAVGNEFTFPSRDDLTGLFPHLCLWLRQWKYSSLMGWLAWRRRLGGGTEMEGYDSRA